MVANGRVYDVTDHVGRVESVWDDVVEGLPLVGLLASLELRSLRSHDIADVVLEAPVPRPGKIIGAPANYYEHIHEMPDSATIREWGAFLKAPTSVTGPGSTVQLPYSDVRTDYEGELAVVIGKGGRNIAAENALEHVLGYTCLLDITVRSTEDRSTRKSFDTFTPLGPWIVTSDELRDPGELELTLSVNGNLRQSTSTSTMIFGVEELIAYMSSVMTLERGDVIATGTPAGVGPIANGDRIDLSITGIGTLSVGVSDADAIPYLNRPGPKAGLYAD
ncbi:hypothetical protein GCM10027406_34880 [Leifsonia lichenia]